MNRFHAPGKEERGIIIVPRAEWEDWLTCRDPLRVRVRSFMRLHPADMRLDQPAPIQRQS
ncbi:hypothetical protein AB4156_06135 [Cupriavidus sp. 2MCAB6]|uniref:hypothetical protein n=1 Tax=Cupriavidus sp. 2MCAB6 TaxID=3232981 RepID=UPI003F90073F